MRKLLNEGARQLTSGIEPAAARSGEVYRIRAGYAVIPRGIAYGESPEIAASMRVA
jgi:hypothetical protein